jgi:hypothetical protein
MSFFSRMRKVEILFWVFVVAFDTVGAADRHCKESCLFFTRQTRMLTSPTDGFP